MSDALWHTYAMRRVMWWLTAITLVPILVGVVARAFRLEAGPLVYVVALMPWLTFACLIPFVFALMARSLSLAAVVAGVSALGAWWLLPLYTSDGIGGGEAFKVATINVSQGEADAAQIVQMVKSREIDILAVQELTPEALTALEDAGLNRELASSYTAAEDGFGGIGLWSRFPIDGQTLDGFVGNAIEADVETPVGDVSVIAVHPAAPDTGDHKLWKADFARLHFVASKALGPTMILGDLNATRDNAPFRALEGLDYKDAADQSGAGLVPTFPEGRTPFPLVAIDHALVRDTKLNANKLVTVSIDGADHRALVVDYVLPGTGS